MVAASGVMSDLSHSKKTMYGPGEHSGAGGGGGSGALYRNLDLRAWPRTACAPAIAFDGETNTVNFTAVRGDYERIYCPAMVQPHADYRFSVRFGGSFEEGNAPEKYTYFAVTSQPLGATYIENQSGIVLAKTRLYSGAAADYAVEFNAGERGFVYLYFDLAAVLDGSSVTLTYANVAFSKA